jgi:hypothetical protein
MNILFISFQDVDDPIHSFIRHCDTALENTMVDENEDLEGFTLLERYRIFQEDRGRFTNIKAIIGSGMNPGILQWMAIELMKQTPGEQPLGCYIVEHMDPQPVCINNHFINTFTIV